MSASSESKLMEAALITDSPQAVAQAAAFVQHLASNSAPLTASRIAALVKIKVKRRGKLPPTLGAKKSKFVPGENTWLVGVYEIDDTPPDEEQFADDSTSEVAAEHEMDDDDVTWIRDTHTSKFARHAQKGDSLIQIWRERARDKTPESVLKPVPILDVRHFGKVTFIFSTKATGKRAELPWMKFKKMMTALGCSQYGRNSERIISPSLAEDIGLKWHKA
jgi:hypothetical protein